MRSERRMLITMLSSLVFTGVLTLGLCVSWFHRNNAIDIDQLTGSVLKRYFEDGDGSAADPFEIARPKQYENFVRLHYEMPDFADRGFSFVLGHNFASEGLTPDYHFYTYSDDGVYSPAQTDVLNMTYICDAEKNKSALPPLGTEELPFKAKLEGNGLTVANFRIGGQGYKDIGIFGYVDQDASVTNAYFKDFEIDTSECAYSENSAGSAHPDHGDSNVYMGYLAGHIHDASSFDDVYINNCTLKGTKQLSKTIDKYGYYGHADVDSLGGQNTNKGGDYRFTLDSEACYNYFNDNYSTINKQQLVLRNTEETGWNGERRMGTGLDPVEFNQAVKKSTAVANYGTTYVLSGNSPSASNQPMTNSLSTIGYVSGPRTVTQFKKTVKYKRDGSSTYSNPDSDSVISLVPSSQNPDPGNYFYNNSGTWEYYHCENRLINDNETFRLTLNFSSARRWYDTYAGTGVSSCSFSGKLFLDQQEINLSCSAKAERTFGQGRYITCNANSVSYTLPLGTHKIALLFTLSWTISGETTTHYFCLAGTVDSSARKLVQESSTPSYTFSSGSGVTQTLSYDFGDYFKSGVFSSDNDIGYLPSNPTLQAYTPAPNDTVLVCESTFSAPLYYLEEGNYYPVVTDSETNFDNALFDKNGNEWTITFTKVVLDDTDESQITNHFTGDEEELTDSGYDSRVIDIVGGDTSFWYYNKSYLFGTININIKIISLPSESTSNVVTKAITESDIGKPFYATKYCPDSVITYIKNVSNAAAHRNDFLGRIDFQYVSTSWISLSTPTFKKGGGVFCNLANSGVEPDDPMEPANDLNQVISRELYEDNVQSVCYCALDKDKNIIGTFNSDGSFGVGMSEDKLKDIYYYVLAVGGQGSNNTWITKVQFEYQAEYGYGGTFGNVGYRSSEDPKIVDGTILNFALVLNEAASNRYEILVYFVKDNNDQDSLIGEYHIEIYTDLAVTSGLNVYNYFPESYNVYVKTSRGGTEVQMAGTSGSFSLPGGTY